MASYFSFFSAWSKGQPPFLFWGGANPFSELANTSNKTVSVPNVPLTLSGPQECAKSERERETETRSSLWARSEEPAVPSAFQKKHSGVSQNGCGSKTWTKMAPW